MVSQGSWLARNVRDVEARKAKNIFLDLPPLLPQKNFERTRVEGFLIVQGEEGFEPLKILRGVAQLASAQRSGR